MRRLVVLRPEPGAATTAKQAREQGMEPLVVPLFEIEPIAWQPREAGSFDGLLLTSANAVRMAGEQLSSFRGLPVYAVGEATAEAARALGFDIASTGNSGVDRLLGSIEPELRLLHLCGEDRRKPADSRQTITAISVYRAKPVEVDGLPLSEGSVVLVHSPRAGRRLSQLVEDRASMAIAAISSAAAEAVGDGWERVEIADAPTDEALLALAARLCNTLPPE